MVKGEVYSIDDEEGEDSDTKSMREENPMRTDLAPCGMMPRLYVERAVSLNATPGSSTSPGTQGPTLFGKISSRRSGSRRAIGGAEDARPRKKMKAKGMRTALGPG